MAMTSATFVYETGLPPTRAAWVAVFGGDSAKAGQHAANVAAGRGATIGGPQWETSPQLNGGRPFRLYPLRYPAERISTAPEPPMPSSGMSPTTAQTEASSRSGDFSPMPNTVSVH